MYYFEIEDNGEGNKKIKLRKSKEKWEEYADKEWVYINKGNTSSLGVY
jgi:hypothetical protein